jgi:hypothetical protein
MPLLLKNPRLALSTRGSLSTSIEVVVSKSRLFLDPSTVGNRRLHNFHITGRTITNRNFLRLILMNIGHHDEGQLCLHSNIQFTDMPLLKL